MNKTLIILVAALAASMLACTAAGALTLDDVIIQTWVGSGSSEALCVIDFGSASYAFGYRFDGEDTGFGMLQAIAANTSLEMAYTDWGWGYSIDRLAYDGNSHEFDTEDPWNSSWWEYWTSTDGLAWESSDVGSNDRVLTDNTWDGWTWSPAYPAVGSAPAVPAVPEPGTLAALALGLGAALTRRRR